MSRVAQVIRHGPFGVLVAGNAVDSKGNQLMVTATVDQVGNAAKAVLHTAKGGRLSDSIAPRCTPPATCCSRG